MYGGLVMSSVLIKLRLNRGMTFMRTYQNNDYSLSIFGLFLLSGPESKEGESLD